MGIKTSIGWTDMTLNPIKGQCKGGCWYCYYSGKKGFLNRFKQDPTIRLNLDVFEKLPFHKKKIFLCSTHDLFGDWIPEHWRDLIFWHIKLWRQHTFQILTKFPQNIDRPMPNNVWVGVTITEYSEMDRWVHLNLQVKAKLKFISFEPLLYKIKSLPCLPNWVIVGRLTGYGKRYDPTKEQLEDIIHHYKAGGIPIFLKNNLKEIWAFM